MPLPLWPSFPLIPSNTSYASAALSSTAGLPLPSYREVKLHRPVVGVNEQPCGWASEDTIIAIFRFPFLSFFSFINIVLLPPIVFLRSLFSSSSAKIPTTLLLQRPFSWLDVDALRISHIIDSDLGSALVMIDPDDS
ncbi:hypothetical protein C8R45DRAFT_1106001 [Mycena sanguinolenta]|nr:hypothetical protein C8R45DRAFT_1106001 [Mycena sanguinolenta]